MSDRPTAKEQFENDDDVAVIELGVSRRELLEQLGAFGMLGGLSGLAGCLGGDTAQNTDSPTDTSSPGKASPTMGGSPAEGESPTETSPPQQKKQPTDQGIPDFTRVPLVPPPTADQMDLSSPKDEQRRMDFVTHNATNQFFTPCVAGMNDALNHLGWKGSFLGPTGNNQAKQVEILNTRVSALTGGKDVLATTVLNKSSYAAPVKAAMEKNIPVLQWNTTVDGWDFDFMMEQFGQVLPYVGQRAFPAGNAVGITAYEKAQEMLGSDTKLTVLPCIAVPGHPALQARTDGFENSIGQQENVEMLSELNVSTDVAQATTRIQDAYAANNDINVILGSGFWAVAGAASLVKNEGLKGEMVVGGFDLPQSTLNAIQNGTATFTVGQDPYSQGFITAQLAWEYMDRGIPMKDYITGVSIIDQSNIEFASQRSGSWDELVSWQNQNYDNAANM